MREIPKEWTITFKLRAKDSLRSNWLSIWDKYELDHFHYAWLRLCIVPPKQAQIAQAAHEIFPCLGSWHPRIPYCPLPASSQIRSITVSAKAHGFMCCHSLPRKCPSIGFVTLDPKAEAEEEGVLS
ncbi:hypothetical protein I7I51_08113 [Histoplasma capsulatum]|uniref:Uncharacterized protein n=1 Tax=Ajellomyces capsulatus TaxID=5037 RepID=A0A8A1M202_AJECA|nr:hypothetical protein I7I51_08113 [Histoplasma capsulatum]